MSNYNRFKCDICGKFISYKEIEEKKALYYMLYPDSHFTIETYVTMCAKCSKKNINKKIDSYEQKLMHLNNVRNRMEKI